MNTSSVDPSPSDSPVPGLPGPLRGALWMVAACVFFAVVGVLARRLGRDLPPLEVAFFRNLFLLVTMGPWIVRHGRAGLRTRRIGRHLQRAMFSTVAIALLFTAFSLMPVAEVMALSFLSPVFATAGAALFLGEKVGPRRWVAVAVGFVGAMVVLRPGTEAMTPAALLAVGSAVFVAGVLLTIKSLMSTESPNAVVAWSGILLTGISLVPALVVWRWPSGEQWLLLPLIGLMAAGVQSCLARSFAAAEASAVLPFDFSRLLFAALFGYLLFGELPDAWTWSGAGIIFAATIYIAQRESRRPKPIAASPTEV